MHCQSADTSDQTLSGKDKLPFHELKLPATPQDASITKHSDIPSSVELRKLPVLTLY